jgi:hypothetical protein
MKKFILNLFTLSAFGITLFGLNINAASADEIVDLEIEVSNSTGVSAGTNASLVGYFSYIFFGSHGESIADCDLQPLDGDPTKLGCKMEKARVGSSFFNHDGNDIEQTLELSFHSGEWTGVSSGYLWGCKGEGKPVIVKSTDVEIKKSWIHRNRVLIKIDNCAAVLE